MNLLLKTWLKGGGGVAGGGGRDVEVTQQLRALATLQEDPGLILRTYMVSHKHL